MQYVADLHFHSKYSRAVSPEMVLPKISEWGRKKGLDILSTTDWTHPLWFREIVANLEEASDGLYKVKSSSFAKASEDRQNSQKSALFILSTEISSIYSQGGQTRRVHNLVFVPNIETAEKVNKELQRRGCNLMADGRPIIGLSSKDLLELVLSIDEKNMLIPCHVWTPWFSLYGSKSGFDSIEECFGNYSKYIYGVETGLSSDPEMNWRIKELENRSIISSSDAHSGPKMGREATVLISNENGISNTKSQISNIQYDDIMNAIKRDPKGKLKIAYTIEFYPEEGKYHYTGHRICGVKQEPKETREKGVICPVCKRPLTVGVMHRVDQLADPNSNPPAGGQNSKLNKFGVKWIGDSSGKHPPFIKLVPLNEIIAEVMESTVASVKVKEQYEFIVKAFGNELNVLLRVPLDDIEKKFGEKTKEGIRKVRMGDIYVDPGFDGEYGKVKIWSFGFVQDKAEEIQSETMSSKKTPQLGLDI